MTTNSMTYNGLDTRVGMTDSTGSRTFKRAGIGVTSPVLSDGSASFAPSGENRAGVKTAYHGGLKSFDTQTNSAQAVVGQRLTDAFGNQISSSGVWKGRFAYGGPYGYQEDPDTGLRLLGHRYYDSSTGRFLTRDPIKDGRNWYVYCESSPVLSTDPAGLGVVIVVLGALALGAAVVGLFLFFKKQIEEGQRAAAEKQVTSSALMQAAQADNDGTGLTQAQETDRDRKLGAIERQRQQALEFLEDQYYFGPLGRASGAIVGGALSPRWIEEIEEAVDAATNASDLVVPHVIPSPLDTTRIMKFNHKAPVPDGRIRF